MPSGVSGATHDRLLRCPLRARLLKRGKILLLAAQLNTHSSLPFLIESFPLWNGPPQAS